MFIGNQYNLSKIIEFLF